MSKTERDFHAEIVNCTKELTKKEEIALKNSSAGFALDICITENGGVFDINNVDYLAELQIHNSKAENTDYTNYIVVTKDGDTYRTGSVTFGDIALDIIKDMEGIDEEFALRCFKVQSKNNAGAYITCNII